MPLLKPLRRPFILRLFNWLLKRLVMRLVGKLEHLAIAPAIAVSDDSIESLHVVCRAHASDLLRAVAVLPFDLARDNAAFAPYFSA